MEIKIPNTKTTLSILGMEQNVKDLSDCDRFADDGYVYDNQGNKKQRWLIKYDNVLLWEPKLNDTCKIENLRFRIITKLREIILPNFNKTADNLKRVGSAYLYVSNGWRKYEYRDIGICWDRIDDDKIIHPLNCKTAKAYYDAEHRVSQYFSYLAKVDKILNKSIINKLGWPKSDENGKRCQLIINNRSYWMLSSYNRYGVLEWTKISWPDVCEDETIVVQAPQG